jgi:hypothetical protein
LKQFVSGYLVAFKEKCCLIYWSVFRLKYESDRWKQRVSEHIWEENYGEYFQKVLLILLLLFSYPNSFKKIMYNYITNRNFTSRLTHSFAGILCLKFYCNVLLLLLLLPLNFYLKQTKFLWHSRRFANILWLQHMLQLM